MILFIGPYLREALSNLVSSKLRSILAILGILVGTGSVVAMVSSGQLATEAALAQFKALGTNLLSVAIYQEGGNQSSSASKVKPFDVAQAVAIKQASDGIELVAPYTTVFLPITFNGHTINSGSIIGATQMLQPGIKIEMDKGRFISFLDLNTYSYYCVIGHQLYAQIKQYTLTDPIGKQIRLGTNIFTIIGVAKKWQENNFFNEDINNAIIIPITTAQLLSKYAEIRNIIMRLKKRADIEDVRKSIDEYIKGNLPGKKTFIRSAQQIIDTMVKSRQIYTILLGLIGSISLLVGGIGVMNIMLVSVVERKREIGIRKAVGAKRRDIRLLFLIEAVALSLFGGLLGVTLGVSTSYVISRFAQWHFQIFILPPLIGFSVSVFTGVFFGFYPAFKAAQLDPIEALRTE